MKTIFEGTINGVKYDDINAYNNRIKELVNDGVAFNAHITSHTVEEDNSKLFPHLITDITGRDWIDRGCNLTLSALRDDLANKFAPIIDDIQNMNEDELNDYIFKLEELGKGLEEHKSYNSSATASIESRLNDVHKRHTTLSESIQQLEVEEKRLANALTYLNKSGRTILEWDRAYENVYHHALETQAKNNESKVDTQGNPEVQAVEKNPVSLQELWECIFGK